MMVRRASGLLVPYSANPSKRIASVTTPGFEMKPGHLYFTTRAMHWEQSDGKGHYRGNSNGDFWEGGMNVVWACNNRRCANKDIHKRFLKYAGKNECPHCHSSDIRDWERETFHSCGELLAKTDDGKYRFESWKNQPLNRNHKDEERLGRVVDVWPIPPEKGIDELLELDIENNKHLAEQIERGVVTGTSLEVLVGASLCSVCFHIATDEKAPKEKGGWCEHLRMYKGRYDPRSNQRAFEICKNLQGSGHAVIATGDPADDGARIFQVFASKEVGTNLNTTMPTPAKKSAKFVIKSENNLPAPNDTKGMPQVSAAVQEIIEKNTAARRSASKTLARSTDSGLPAGSVTVPDFSSMGDQLKVFGNFMSSRTAEEVAMAKLPPSIRAKLAALDKLDPKSRQALGIEQASPLRVDKEFVAGHLKEAVATRKVAAKDVVSSLAVLTGVESEREQFITALTERSANLSGAVKRLTARRAQLQDGEGIRELVIDTLSDALQQAGESLSQAVTDDTISDTITGADALVDSDESQNDFVAYLEEGESPQEQPQGEIASDENAGVDPEESSVKEAVMTKEIPLSRVEATEEENQMNKTAQSQPHVTSQETIKPETEVSAKDLGGSVIKNPAPVSVPASTERTTPGETFPSSKSVTAALQERKAALQAELLEAAPEKFQEIVAALKRVEAQMKIETESFPTAKELGGSVTKNPAPVDVKAMEVRKTPSESSPGSDEAAVSVQEGKGIEKVAQSNFVKDGKVEVAAPPADRSAKPEEFPLSKEQKRPEGDKVRDMKKEIHPGNEDNAEEKEKMTKSSESMGEEARKLKNQGVASPSTTDADKQDIAAKGQSTPTPEGKSDDEIAKLKGQQVKTPTISPEEQDKLQGKTEVSKAKSPKDDAKLEGADSITKSSDRYDDATSLGANPDAASYPKDMLRSGELAADFCENTEPGKRSASFWEVKLNGKPMCRISAKAAYEDEVIKYFSVFASADYGRKLVEALREEGLDEVATKTFNPGALEILSEKTAQSIADGMPGGNTAPASTPINVSPAVADNILNETKPGLSIADLLANLLAPLVIESESLSTSGVMQDIVELANNQDKVTELTTKLNDNVQKIRSSAGLPAEASAPAGTAPAAVPPAANAAPGAVGNMQPTAPGPQATGATQMTAQASRVSELETENRKLQAHNSALLRGQRIEQVVKAAQNSGIVEGYNKFIRAGKSRKEAKRMAQASLEKETTRILGLPNDACEQALDTMLSACRAVAAATDKPAARRTAAFLQMQREAGVAPLGTLPGETGVADMMTDPKSRSMKLSWKVANGIDPEKHDQALSTVHVRKD